MKKTAIVTGSSRGIGFAIAKQLGLDGYNIVMVATGPQEKNQHALDELKAMGIDCAYVQANIGSADDRKKILDGALAAFGRVDVLVNNAGVAPKVRADLLDMSEESFDYVVGINTKGNMFLTQLVAKQMISQEPVDGRKGVIVNVYICMKIFSFHGIALLTKSTVSTSMEHISEHVTENIAHIATFKMEFLIIAALAKTTLTKAALTEATETAGRSTFICFRIKSFLKSSKSILIIKFSLFFISKDIIGFINLFELFCCLFISLIRIRMILLR